MSHGLRVTLLAVWLLSAAAANAAVNTWSATGPEGGVVSRLRYHPSQPNIIHAIVSGHLYRSTDAGAHWISGPSIQADLSPLWDLALDPTNGNTLYVAAESAGFYRSEDGGLTFSRLMEGVSVERARRIALSADGGVIYLGENNGSITVSVNHGASWQRTIGSPPIAADDLMDGIAIDAGDAAIVYALLQKGGIYKSANGGNSWSAANTGLPAGGLFSEVVAHPNIPGRAYVATSDGLFSTNDGGVHWSQMQFGSRLVKALSISPVNPMLLLAVLDDEIQLSTDGGTTWRVVMASMLGAPGQTAAWNPQDAQKAAVGTVSGIYLTDNVGALPSPVWSTSHSGIFATTPSALVAANDGTDRLYLGLPAVGMATTSANSQRWTTSDVAALRTAAQTDSSLNIMALETNPADAMTVTAALLDIGLLRSNDAGASWHRLAETDARLSGTLTLTVDPADPKVFYAGTIQDGILTSADDGATWNTLNTGLPSCTGPQSLPTPHAVAVDPANPLVLYMMGNCTDGSGFGVYRSTNKGASWVSASSAIAAVSGNAIAIDPAQSQILYLAASGSSSLYRSIDSGHSWKAIGPASGAGSGFHVVIDHEIPSTIYVAAGGVYRSVDRGETWETLRAWPSDPYWNVTRLALDPVRPHIIYAAVNSRGVQVMEVAPDLKLALSGHTGTRTVGVAAQFTIEVQNAGPWAATGVVISGNLPAGVSNVTVTPADECQVSSSQVACSIALLRNGEQRDIVVGYVPAAEGSLTVSATVGAHEADGDSSNNEAQSTVEITAAPTTPPSKGGGGGGGGIGLEVFMLALMLLSRWNLSHPKVPTCV